MAEIWLIRHGQAGDLLGDYDLLSPRGKAQARRAGERWRHLQPIRRVISGTMRRHLETMAAFGEGFGPLPQVEIQPAFDEFDHLSVIRAAGPPPEVDPTDPHAAFLQVFHAAMGRWASGEHDADYAEPYERFQARVAEGLTGLASQLESGQTALVFTSGGVISAACRHLLGLSPEAAFRVNLVLANTGFTRVLRRRGQVSLASLNVHPHLDEAPELFTRF